MYVLHVCTDTVKIHEFAKSALMNILAGSNPAKRPHLDPGYYSTRGGCECVLCVCACAN